MPGCSIIATVFTQNAIAKRMQVSRSTVSNYLRIAREQGIVDIRINGAAFTHSTLARELREKFDLSDVYIAETDRNLRPEDLDRQVGILAAMALRDILVAGDRIGVAWGDLIGILSQELPGNYIDDLEIHELLGGSGFHPPQEAEASAARLAARLGGVLYSLRCPVLTSSSELGHLLRSELRIPDQLAQMRDVNRSIFSIEGVEPKQDNAWSWLLNSPEADDYRKLGAVALYCGQFLDAGGHAVEGPLKARTIAVDLENLRKAKKGILVAAGAYRARAVRATLVGGFVDYLVIDQDMAIFLSRS